MAKKQMTPMERVAHEMGDHSSLSEDEFLAAVNGLVEHLQSRAMEEIKRDQESEAANRSAEQYLACVELINVFGTSLIACDDIEEFELAERKPDGLSN